MKALPIAEYHEDMGPVLWWAEEQKKCVRCDGDGHVGIHANLPDVKCSVCDGKGTIGAGKWKGEPPYVGSPLDLGFSVYVDVTLSRQYDGEVEPDNNDLPPKRFTVGGWPGYHTHFTPLPPMPDTP